MLPHNGPTGVSCGIASARLLLRVGRLMASGRPCLRTALRTASATQRSGQQQPHRHSCRNLLKSWRESTDDPAMVRHEPEFGPVFFLLQAACSMIFMVWPRYKESSSSALLNRNCATYVLISWACTLHPFSISTLEPLQWQKKETKTICTVRASNVFCLQNILACILNAGYL